MANDEIDLAVDAALGTQKWVRNFWATLGILGKLLVGGVLVALILLLGYRMFFLTSTKNYHLVYIYDRWNGGRIDVVGHQGYVHAWPFLQSVYTIDTRPFQTCLTANRRVMNCKLVNFNVDNPEGLLLFLSWHGTGDYSIDNTDAGGFQDILKAYAFDQNGRSFPFLTVGSVTSTPTGSTP